MDLTINGDLNQMSIQSSFLRTHGFDMERVNVYSVIKSEDVENALRLLWTHKVEGWWHYFEKYEKYGICTKEQYRNQLTISVEMSRR